MQKSQMSVNETVIIFYKNSLNTILKYSVNFVADRMTSNLIKQNVQMTMRCSARSIVWKYGTKILELINILKKQCQKNMDAAGVKYNLRTVLYTYFTPATSMLLEMDHVRLLDDFTFAGVPYSRYDPNTFMSKEKDEMNLLYVALTIAKKSLTMNSALFFMFTLPVFGNFPQHVCLYMLEKISKD